LNELTPTTIQTPAEVTPADGAALAPDLTKGQIAAVNRKIAASKNDMEVAKCVHRVFRGQIAYFGGHMWILTGSGGWKIASRWLRHWLLTVFKEFRPAHFQALCLDARVDLLNEESPRYYYTRPASEDYAQWQPLDQVGLSDVVWRNGKLDLRTRAFTPWPDGQLIFGLLLGHEYDPPLLARLEAGDLTGASPEFLTLLDSIDYALADDAGVPRPALVRYFQQVVAQVLRPHVLYPFFVHVIGESGARKTTILRALLTAPSGAAAVNEIPEHVLADRVWAKAGLVNRLANLSNDADKSQRFVTFVKEYTSGTMQSERKFQDAEQTRVTAKLFATLNESQLLADASRGVENRLIVFRFNCRERENDRSAQGTRWMDPDSYGPECRKWVTHWLLAGLLSTYQGGVEHVPAAPPEALAWREEMLRDNDPARRFFAERLDLDPASEVKVADLDSAAQTGGYVPDGGLHAFKTALGKFLVNRHPEVVKVRKDHEQKGDDGAPKRVSWYVWRGLRLRV
jgi:hypothetical protein